MQVPRSLIYFNNTRSNFLHLLLLIHLFIANNSRCAAMSPPQRAALSYYISTDHSSNGNRWSKFQWGCVCGGCTLLFCASQGWGWGLLKATYKVLYACPCLNLSSVIKSYHPLFSNLFNIFQNNVSIFSYCQERRFSQSIVCGGISLHWVFGFIFVWFKFHITMMLLGCLQANQMKDWV